MFKVPQLLCAEMYLYGIFRYKELSGSISNLREIHIVDINPSIIRDIEKVYEATNTSAGTFQMLAPKYSRKRHPSVDWTAPSKSVLTSASTKHTDRNSDNDRSQEKVKKETPISAHTTNISVRQLRDDNINGITAPIKVFHFQNGLKVKLYTGSLVKFKGDAIVCSADAYLTGVGPLAEAVKAAGGRKYEQSFTEMRSGGRHRTKVAGDVFVCDGGNLNVSKVFHLVVETVYSEYSLQEYSNTLQRIFEALRKNGISSVAIPLIGAGTYFIIWCK